MAATTVSPPIVQQIGRKAAFELLTLCENVSPARALELGMINRVAPADARVHNVLGEIARGAGDHDRARSHFEEAIRLAPEWDLPRTHLRGLGD